MHNAMADSHQLQLRSSRNSQRRRPAARPRQSGTSFERECLIDNQCAVRIPGPQPRPAADPIDLPFG